jgi:hypothetical protein
MPAARTDDQAGGAAWSVRWRHHGGRHHGGRLRRANGRGGSSQSPIWLRHCQKRDCESSTPEIGNLHVNLIGGASCKGIRIGGIESIRLEEAPQDSLR